MSENKFSTCPNCNQENVAQYKYCIECGQKNRPNKITFYEFVKDFFDVVFNLDNRFWKTVKLLFIPGKLTEIFFQGKRQSYYHPLRLYLVGVLFLFTILSIFKIDNLVNFGSNANFKENYIQEKIIRDQGVVLNETLNVLKTEFSETSEIRLLDTVSKRLFLVNNGDTIYIDNEKKNDSTDIKMFFNQVNFSQDELLVSDIDSVLDKKNVDGFLDRLVMKQFIKGMRDVKSFNAYIFANLTWLFLAVIPVFSFILKLFYIRRKRYYMEHFVFLLHLFTSLIFINCFLIIIFIPPDQKGALMIINSFIFTIFPFLAFKFYYKQGFMKTFIKYMAIGFCFFFAFLFTFLIFLFVSAAFF